MPLDDYLGFPIPMEPESKPNKVYSIPEPEPLFIAPIGSIVFFATGNSAIVIKNDKPGYTTVKYKDGLIVEVHNSIITGSHEKVAEPKPLNDFLGGTYRTESDHYHVFIISRLAQDFIDPLGKAHSKGCYIGLVLEDGVIGIWDKDGKCKTLPKLVSPKNNLHKWDELDLKQRVGQRPY